MQREWAGSSLVDILDRLLDRGIVIDARRCSRSTGIDLVSGGAKVRVVSTETYYEGADPGAASPDDIDGPTISDLRSELTRVRRESDPKNGPGDVGA